jgi:biopolymer transport protein TolR
MASVSDGGGGNKRPSSFDLNLVPFIDLMSVMITFLLITAVWTQVSMIKLGSSIYGKNNTPDDNVPPPPPSPVLRLEVKEIGYRLTLGNPLKRSSDQFVIEKINGEYNKVELAKKLEQFKQAYPDKVDAVIGVEEKLKYDYLIQGMDVLLQSGFPAVSVATGGFE